MADDQMMMTMMMLLLATRSSTPQPAGASTTTSGLGTGKLAALLGAGNAIPAALAGMFALKSENDAAADRLAYDAQLGKEIVYYVKTYGGMVAPTKDETPRLFELYNATYQP